MKKTILLWPVRCLALAHFAWGFLLLLIAAYMGFGMFRVIPSRSSGTIGTNLLWALIPAAFYIFPLGVLGLWMIVLGRWTWAMRPRIRNVLLITHGVLLLFGTLAVIEGVYAMNAAERSTAGGGGLLSPLAAVPLIFGVPVCILAILSIIAALTLISWARQARTK